MERNGKVRDSPVHSKRVPPHDLDAERAVIGAMLVSQTAIAEVASRLVERAFYSETHRLIFRAAKALYDRSQPVDQITLANELRRDEQFEKIGGREYVFELVESVPTTANAVRYAEIVRGKALLRAAIDTATRITEDAFREPEDVGSYLDKAEQQLFAIGDGVEDTTMEGVDTIATDTLAHIQALYEADGRITGVPSGFSDLDKITGGWQSPDLIIFGGRPSMGKTSLGVQVAKNAAEIGVGVAYFSLEMSKHQIMVRLISQESGVASESTRDGKLTPGDWDALVRATAKLRNLPLYVDDNAAITVTRMRAKLRRLASRLEAQGAPLGLVVVDYVQLMVGEGKDAENRQTEVSAISRTLKITAGELGVPVIALAQLSRAVEYRHDKRPRLSDLRDSGSLEQDADLVCLLFREEYYQPDTDKKGQAEVIVGKHRNGSTGSIELAWLDKQARFASLSRG